MQRLGKYLFCLCCGLFFLHGASAQERDTSRNTLRFGLMPYLSARNLLNIYQPVAQSIEKSLGQPVQMLSAPDFDTFNRRVLTGDYDLILLAPHYARLAIRDHGFNPVFAHKAPIRGLIVTAADNPLADINALRGQEVAIVDRSALIVITGAQSLAEGGLQEERDYRFVESVSHASALHSAVTGKTRAALISHSTLASAPADIREQAVVWRELSQIPGQFLIADKRLNAEQVRLIRRGLLDFEKSPEGQQFFEKTRHGGYREITAEDYRLLDRLLPETRRLLGQPGR